MEYCYRVSYIEGYYTTKIKLFCQSDQLFSKISAYFQNNHISDEYVMYSMITNIKKIDCYGCKHDRPGQIDHMGQDGCLGQ